MCMDFPHVGVQITTEVGFGVIPCSGSHCSEAHFFVHVLSGGEFGVLLSHTALGYNLVKYCMCKYPVGAVMWYTLYKKKKITDFIGVSVYNSDNKKHPSVYLSPPVWFDGLLTSSPV